MATTNLISKSLGDLLTESGNGTPDHTSPKGSLYSDKDTGVVWVNTDDATAWQKLNSVAYGEVVIEGNTTSATTISSANQWTPSGVGIVEGFTVGFSGSSQYLILKNGYDGDYSVRLDATLSHIAGTPNFEVGISVNDNDPLAGRYSGCYIDSTQSSQHVGVQSIINLTGGTKLSVDIQNLTDTSNVYLEHLQLFARKVG
jgi:hypothetical protein